MAENYDLIFGQSASQQYAWSDSDYQNGWQTVGSTPPTAEQFDALQRRSDTKAQDLNNRLSPIEEKSEADGRQAATTYTAGAMVTVDGLPNGWLLECVVPGTSGTDAITLPDTLIDGLTIIDGDVTWALRKVATNGSLGYRQPSTAYTAGQIAYHASLPTGYYLECTTDGTTGSGALSITTTTPNAIITDGTLTWAIRQIVNIIASPSYYQREQLPTPAQTSITINPTWLNIGGVGYTLKQALTLNINSADNWDASTYATAANRAGKDVYIYATATENSITPGFVLSLNSTVPTGYTADNSRKIGGFHCLCAAVGSITGHTLTGYVAGDILPQSVWDLSFRAVSENAGMVWVKGINKWVDIYLPSWQNGGMASVYGGTIVDGVSAVPITGELAAEYYGLVGKQLITRDEFLVAMAGNPQGVNIAGSADPGTTGGHSATNGVRIVSNYGIEDGVGVLWQWGADQYENYPGSTWTAANYYLNGYAWQTKSVQNDDIETSGKGSCYGLLRRVLLGADWGYGAYCGSRAAACGYFSAYRLGNVSARGVASIRATA